MVSLYVLLLIICTCALTNNLRHFWDHAHVCMHVSHNKILGVYMFGKKAAHTGMTSCQCCSGLTCVLMLIVCVQIEGLGRLWAQTHMHVCVCACMGP